MVQTSDKLFHEELEQNWKDHTKQPELVCDRLQRQLHSRLNEDQLLEVASIASHIYGEHLGRWNDGLSYLEKLRNLHHVDSHSVQLRFQRQQAILMKAQEPSLSFNELQEKDRFYIFTLTVAALALQRPIEFAFQVYEEAEKLLEKLKEDREQRLLFAVMTANLTCDLLEWKEFTQKEIQFLLLVAEKSRTLWAQDGNPSDCDRATFRLLQSYQLSLRPQNYGSGRYPRFHWIKP